MPLLNDPRLRPLWRASVVLGVGLGGFVDGILLHQVLQWHHMASGIGSPRADDLPFNTLLDGLFHAATWLFVLAGIVLLFRAWSLFPDARDGRVLAGGMLTGWGAFNLVEGIIDHHLLGLHHVWPDGPGGRWVWDIAFLALGVLLLLGGILLARRGD